MTDKFKGQIANLRIHDRALSADEIKQDIQADETATTRFRTANPIEFQIYNDQDERVLYITENDKDLQTMILELSNTSPQDLLFQTPDSSLRPQKTWGNWQAGKELYHFQIRFRPGTLSQKSLQILQNPALRLATLSTGWDLKFDPDDTDLMDWISFLYVGQKGTTLAEAIQNATSGDGVGAVTTELTGLKGDLLPEISKFSSLVEVKAIAQRLKTQFKVKISRPSGTQISSPEMSSEKGSSQYDSKGLTADDSKEVKIQPSTGTSQISSNGEGIEKKSTRRFFIPGLSAEAGGGARGTRIQLGYDHLIYKEGENGGQSEKLVPTNTRIQFLNIVNHQGKREIPLHVGFVGSNTILNDGTTPNELTLRITNISRTDSITFRRTSESNASKFTISFDIQRNNENWALTSPANGSAIEVAIRDSERSEQWIPARPNSQAESLQWSFTYSSPNETTLQPGQSITLEISGILSSSPAGYTNLYFRYEDIPGYWDGRFICLIEKTPLVYRNNCVGIGTDEPVAKLHVDVSKENASAGQNKKPAAIFEGGNVGIGSNEATNQLHISGRLGIRQNYQYLSGDAGGSSWSYNAYRNKDNNWIFPDRNRASLTVNMDDQLGKQPRFQISSTTSTDTGSWIQRFALNGDTGNVGIGTEASTSKLTIAASSDHLQLIRSRTENTRGKKLFLELFQEDQTGTTPDVFPSIRFHHSNHFWHRIEAQRDGIHFKNGHLDSDAYVKIFAENMIVTGMIVMWSGQANAIPSGWALCNGQNGTPDLTDRFIVGAGRGYSVGRTGGEDSVTLNIHQMPGHNHSVQFDSGAKGDFGGGSMAKADLQTNVLANYVVTTSFAGGNQPHENKPPYYALCFIMKT